MDLAYTFFGLRGFSEIFGYTVFVVGIKDIFRRGRDFRRYLLR